MKKRILFLILQSLSVFAYPQSDSTPTLFEDKDGVTSIYLRKGGYFRLNTSDASLKLSYVLSNTKDYLFGGFDIAGNTQNGILPLLSEGQIVPGFDVNFCIGIKEILSGNNVFWAGGKLGYKSTSFDIFNPSNDFSSQIHDTSFNTVSLSVFINGHIFDNGRGIIGLSIGYDKVNNYKDLNDIEITDETVFSDSAYHIIRSSKKTIIVKTGNYEEHKAIPINADFFWYPSNRFGFYFLWRSKILYNGGISRIFEDNMVLKNSFGAGFYLLNNKSPFASNGGVTFQINDICKAINHGIEKDFTISFVVGYKFKFLN